MHFRPMPIMSVFAIAGLAVLCWLGSWQWGRYQYKLNLPEEIPELEFVELSGSAAGQPYQFLYTTWEGQPLWRVLEAYDGCLGDQIVDETCVTPYFVDVALLNTLEPETADPDFPAAQLSRLVVHENSDYKPFGAPSQSGRDKWYVADAAAMATRLGLVSQAAEARILEPEKISVLRPKTDGGYDRADIDNPFANPAKMDDLPPARHLGYALTWFGLAATLIGVYFAFHVSAGRLRLRNAKEN